MELMQGLVYENKLEVNTFSDRNKIHSNNSKRIARF